MWVEVGGYRRGDCKNWFLAGCIPIRGTASLVLGMISETMFMKTVRDRRIVTPETITVQERLCYGGGGGVDVPSVSN